MIPSVTRQLRVVAFALLLMLAPGVPLYAQVLTITGSGTTQEWRTYAGGSFTTGAPAVLEAAFPVGAPFTATVTYDVGKVTLSFSEFPTSRYYRGHDLVTAMSIQAAGHTVTRDPASIFQAAAGQVLIINEPPADSLYTSADSIIDGSKTFSGYRVVFNSVGITDFDAIALPDTNLPAAVCPGEWEQLEVLISLVDGESPGENLYQLRGVGTPDRSVDSDRDSLSDGTELGSGSNPCNPDTDGDGLNDGVDPNPLVPRSSTDALAAAVRASATGVLDIPESRFTGPNENAERGRRNALANQLQSAANAIEAGNLDDALAILEHVRDRLDGNPAPPDVMEDGPAKDALREDVERLIARVRAEIGQQLG